MLIYPIISLPYSELTHEVAVEKSHSSPVAGQRITLTCAVTSDLPTTLSWRGPSATRANVSEMTVMDGTVHTLNLSFDSLRMSDGGLYECHSEMKVSHVENSSSRAILLEVQG